MVAITVTGGVGSRGTKEVVQRTTGRDATSINISGTFDSRLFVLANAAYDETGPPAKNVTELSVFTNYTFTAGDRILLDLGDGRAHSDVIATKEDNDTITLTGGVGADVASGVTNRATDRLEAFLEFRIVQDGGSTEVVTWTRPPEQELHLVGLTGTWEARLDGDRRIAISAITTGASTTITLATAHGHTTTNFTVTLAGTGVAGLDGTHTATQTSLTAFTVPVTTSGTPAAAGHATLEGQVPVGSWYNWDFRMVNAAGTVLYSDLSATSKWGVGLLGVIFGQSNAQGLYTKESSPASADANVGVYLNSTSPTGDENTWIDIVTGQKPQGNGIHALINDLQAAATTAFGMAGMPIGIIGAAVNASALIEEAAFTVPAVWWLDERETGVYETARELIVAATDHQNLEFILWQQGEAETTTVQANGFLIEPGTYYREFTRLHGRIKADYKTVNGAETPVIMGGIANLFAQFLGNCSAMLNAREVVLEDILRYATDNNLGFVYAGDVEVDTAATIDYGLHWVAAGYATFGLRAGQVIRKVLGLDAAALQRRGPRITSAVFGTAADPTSRNAITLNVAHELAATISSTATITVTGATTLTLPAAQVPGSATFTVTISGVTGNTPDINGIHTATRSSDTVFTITPNTTIAGTGGTFVFPRSLTRLANDAADALVENCFEVTDELGPMFVSDAAIHADGDKIELTLARDTTTAGAQYATDFGELADTLVGNHAVVRYMALGTIPRHPTDADAQWHLFDNGTTGFPLLPTYGYSAAITKTQESLGEEFWPRKGSEHTGLANAKGYTLKTLRVAATAVSAATVTLPAPNTWPAGSLTVPQPGDRLVFQDDAPALDIGKYIAEATVSHVSTYTDLATTVVLTISHSVAPLPVPPVAPNLVLIMRPKTPCGILATSRNGTSFGV